MTRSHITEEVPAPAGARVRTPTGRRLFAWLPTARGSEPEGGVVMIEFALVLPILLFILFLVFEFGKVFNFWIDQTHLASEGARLAAVDRVPPEGLRAYLLAPERAAIPDELADGGTDSVPDPLEVCIDFPEDSIDGTSGEVGDPVKVTVRTRYVWRLIIDAPVADTVIQDSATHRLEREPTYAAGCDSS